MSAYCVIKFVRKLLPLTRVIRLPVSLHVSSPFCTQTFQSMWNAALMFSKWWRMETDVWIKCECGCFEWLRCTKMICRVFKLFFYFTLRCLWGRVPARIVSVNRTAVLLSSIIWGRSCILSFHIHTDLRKACFICSPYQSSSQIFVISFIQNMVI